MKVSPSAVVADVSTTVASVIPHCFTICASASQIEVVRCSASLKHWSHFEVAHCCLRENVLDSKTTVMRVQPPARPWFSMMIRRNGVYVKVTASIIIYIYIGARALSPFRAPRPAARALYLCSERRQLKRLGPRARRAISATSQQPGSGAEPF